MNCCEISDYVGICEETNFFLEVKLYCHKASLEKLVSLLKKV